MLLAKVNPESKADRDQILSRDEDGKPVAREVDAPVPQRQKTKAETMASLREEYPSTVLKIVDGSPSMSERIFGTVDSVVHGAKKAFGFDPKRVPPGVGVGAPRRVPQGVPQGAPRPVPIGR